MITRLYKAVVGKDTNVKLPQFTSCSPGWVKYIEHFYPEYIDNLSSAKSPQQMFGALLKTYYAKIAGIDPAGYCICSSDAMLCKEIRMQQT